MEPNIVAGGHIKKEQTISHSHAQYAFSLFSGCGAIAATNFIYYFKIFKWINRAANLNLYTFTHTRLSIVSRKRRWSPHIHCARHLIISSSLRSAVICSHFHRFNSGIVIFAIQLTEMHSNHYRRKLLCLHVIIWHHKCNTRIDFITRPLLHSNEINDRRLFTKLLMNSISMQKKLGRFIDLAAVGT